VSRSAYLAGPEVFLPDAAARFEAMKAACAQFGFIGKAPLDNQLTPLAHLTPTEVSREIYRANVETMRACEFGIFNLTPFRGPSADVGTAFELGFMTALGKPVFGYANAAGDYLDRVTARKIHQAPGRPATWHDENGWEIEDFGNADNLMVDSALAISGAALIRHDPHPADPPGDLTAFHACLRRARDYFARLDAPI